MLNIYKAEVCMVEERDGAWSVRDIELAERVGLDRPREIRPTIAKALADGALTVGCEGVPVGAGDPVVWLRKEGAPHVEFLRDSLDVAQGHINKVPEILRTERGRLSTGEPGSTWAHWHLALSYAKWISPEFALKVNSVYKAWRDGSLTAPAPAGLTAEQVDEIAERAAAKVGEALMRRLDERDARPPTGGINAKRWISVRLKEIRELMSDGQSRKQRASALGDATMDLRRRLGFVGTGCSFDNLSPEQFCQARIELEAMVRAAEKVAKARQLSLVVNNDRRPMLGTGT